MGCRPFPCYVIASEAWQSPNDLETLYNILTMAVVKVPTIDKRERIPQEAIDEVVRQIAEKFKPQKIILFGSYARGNPRPESDVDILVVMETPLKESKQSLEIRHYLGVMFGLDLIVYKPQNLEKRLEMGDWFLRDIIREWKVVYESSDR